MTSESTGNNIKLQEQLHSTFVIYSNCEESDNNLNWIFSGKHRF